MKSRIRKMLMGDAVFSEYSKITTPDDMPEKAYLNIAGDWIDVSSNHWILCIEPIVFGIWMEKCVLSHGYEEGTACHMYFSDADEDRKKVIRGAEADLTLEIIHQIEEEEGALLIMKLKKSNIYQLNFIKTYLMFYRYYRRGDLSFTRFKSFVSAYSYPRRIRLVSYRDGDYFNIFPMDLLGDLGAHKRYVFGLRHTNTTLSRIMETGKLAVAEVSHAHKEIIYQLGRHHSGSPPSLDELPFGVRLSKNFEFYIPLLAESYKEVHILQTMNLGSHMLLWGKTLDEEIMTEAGEHLYLVHFLHFLYQKNRMSYKLV